MLIAQDMKVAFYAFNIFSPSDTAGFAIGVTQKKSSIPGNNSREPALKDYNRELHVTETVKIYQKVL